MGSVKHGSRGQFALDFPASKNRETQYYQNQLYIVKGFWKHRTWQDQNGQTRHENAFYITDLQSL